MDRSRVTERIVKLLRLAANKPDEPQGQNALNHAKRLMKKYRMEITLVDVVDDEPKKEVAAVVFEGPPGQFAVPTLWNLVGKIFEFDTAIQGNTMCAWVVWSGGRVSELDEAKQAAKDLVATFERRVDRFIDEDDTPEMLLEFRMAAAGALEVWATRRFGLPMPGSQEEVPVEATITVSADSTAMVLYSEKIEAPSQEPKVAKTEQLRVDMANKRVVEIVDYFVRHQLGVSWLPIAAFRRACAYVARKRNDDDVPWRSR